LADHIAVSTDAGLDSVATAIHEAVQSAGPAALPVVSETDELAKLRKAMLTAETSEDLLRVSDALGVHRKLYPNSLDAISFERKLRSVNRRTRLLARSRLDTTKASYANGGMISVVGSVLGAVVALLVLAGIGFGLWEAVALAARGVQWLWSTVSHLF
jgi:hypothetical protein